MKINKEKLVWITLGILLFLLSMPQKAIASSILNNANGDSTYTVTFDSKGGTVTANTMSVNHGSTYGELPTVTRDNYVFKGWYTSANGGNKVTEDSTVKATVSHTLYAHWFGKEYEISLDANGGKIKNDTVTVYYGSKYKNQLPIPTMENYKFVGWYTAIEDGEKITPNSIFGANSKNKLYAHWTEKTLKITLIGFNDELYEKEVISGKEYGELPVPKKENYIFGGWYTWEDYSNNDAEPITEKSIATKSSKLKLFARWYFAK